MKVVKRKVEELLEDPANVRTHPERNLERIRRSLEKFGQQKPVVIDGKNTVRAGNGTLAAAKLLGWKELDCVVSTLDANELVAYAIADNASGELAGWNEPGLLAALRAIEDAEKGLAAAAGFDEKDLATLAKQIAGPTRPDDFPGVDESTNRACPSCGFRWHEAD